MLALLREPETSATDATDAPGLSLAPALRLLRSGRTSADWQMLSNTLHFLLDARGPEDVTHRAAASVGLLPSVAWTDTEGRPHGRAGSLAVALKRPPKRAGASSDEDGVGFRWLEIGLANPSDLDAKAMVENLLSLIAKVYARELERQRLTTEAYRDALTGLWNRRAFDTFLDQALARRVRTATPLALIVCDLDHFKQVNDGLGHAAGDLALRHVATCMEQAIRPSDIAARLGGDEMVILLNDSDAEGAMRVANRLQLAVTSDNPLAPAPLTLSMGIADHHAFEAGHGPHVAPAANVHPLTEQRHALFEAADRALYRAKEHGRNRACIDALSEPRVVSPGAHAPSNNDDYDKRGADPRPFDL